MDKICIQYAMYACIACGACQTACKNGRGLQAGEYYRRVEKMHTDRGLKPFSGACNHCEKPACVQVCPTGAMQKREDGVVLHVDELCIACGACLWNCPYGAISFSKAKGVTQKCDSCYDRRMQNTEPFCVEACPMHCLHIGMMPELIGEKPELPFFPPFDQTEPSLRLERRMPK